MKKIHKLMILSLILAASYLITNLELLQPNLKTDNFINPNDNIIENLNKEIAQLEQDSKATKTYTIQYKKRVDYNKNPTSSEALDYKDSIIEETFTPKEENKQEEKLQPIPYQNVLRDSKPKIVIIIDDILNTKQLNNIKSIDLKLTPSIFPNNNIDMINATNKLDFFMIHLPLEAKKYTDELDTIKIGDSIDRIRKKIESIKSSMPSVKYINNHTGSKFTANKKSVETLLSVLDDNKIKLNIEIPKDKALNEIAKEQNRLILHRDIFVDNSLELSAINKQITEGIKIAKKRGYAILIAHPHKETLHALKLAKDNIFKDVDVIYLNELDEILQNAKITQYTQKAS